MDFTFICTTVYAYKYVLMVIIKILQLKSVNSAIKDVKLVPVQHYLTAKLVIILQLI